VRWNALGTPAALSIPGRVLATGLAANPETAARQYLQRNVASTASGASVSGDGVNLDKIADDTEATDWASLSGVAGKQVTVDLAGDEAVPVNTVHVSALLRPAVTGDAHPGSQNRFSALRSFAVLACNAEEVDCSHDAGYHTVFTSAPDAFPGGAFRPTASQLAVREFPITPTEATHLRLQVLTSQCTGNPRYAGEQDDDPRAATDREPGRRVRAGRGVPGVHPVAAIRQC
jgi:hypothetical protein